VLIVSKIITMNRIFTLKPSLGKLKNYHQVFIALIIILLVNDLNAQFCTAVTGGANNGLSYSNNPACGGTATGMSAPPTGYLVLNGLETNGVYTVTVTSGPAPYVTTRSGLNAGTNFVAGTSPLTFRVTTGTVAHVGVNYNSACQSGTFAGNPWNGTSAVLQYTREIPNTPSTPTITYNCSNQTILSSSSAPKGGIAPTYLWQGSNDGSSWSDIGGATSTNYTITAATNPQYLFYRQVAYYGSCSSASASSAAVVPRGNFTGNITITTNTTLYGVYNFSGNFTVNNGVTVFVPQGCPLEINATDIIINGTINGNSAGNGGGGGGSEGIMWANDGGTDGRGITYCWDKDNCRELRLYGGNGGAAGGGVGGGGGGATAAYKSGVKQDCQTWDDEGGRVAGSGGAGAAKGGGYGGAGGNGAGGGRGGDETGCYTSGCYGTDNIGGSGGGGSGTGGGTYDNTTDYLIFMGSGGGGAGGGGRGAVGAFSGGSSGGNGGGAVALKACRNLTLGGSASILVNGAVGGSGGNGGNSTFTGECCSDAIGGCDERTYSGSGGGGGGGGGGSGGGVLLSAYGNMTLTAGSQLSANGGNGGGGGAKGFGAYFDNAVAGGQGGGGGGGRIKIFTNPCATNTLSSTNSTSGGSGAANGSAGTYSVNTHPSYIPLVAGNITSSGYTICYNTNPATAINADASNGGGNNSALSCTSVLPAFQYQWYVTRTACASPTTGTGSSANAGWAAIAGASSQNMTAANILAGINTVGGITTSGTYCFQRRTQSVNCYAWTGTVSIVIQSQPTAGAIAADQTICFGGDPAAFTSTTAGTGDGTITYRWERSVSPFSTWNPVGGASAATYDEPSGLTVTSQFRRITISTLNGVACESPATTPVQVTVRPNFNGGTLTSAAQSICFNTTPANITYSVSPSGGSTTTYQWYMQTGSVSCPSGAFNGTGWTAVGAASTSTPSLTGATIGNLTATTTFALRVYDSGTPACYDNWAGNCHVVTVRPVFAGGTLTSTAQTICNNTQPADITYSTAPSGGSTTTYQWYMQTGSVACPSGAFNGTGWTAVGAASTSTPTLTGATIGNLTATTTFALRVYDTGTPNCFNNWAGNCHVVTVRPAFAGGTLTSAAQSICFNTTPANITYSVSPSGGSTTTYQWYMQTGSVSCPSGAFNGTGWTAVGAASTSTPSLTGATIGNLTATTTFALRVYDSGTPACYDNWAGNCHVVTVRPVFAGGTLTSTAQTICNNTQPADITYSTAPSGGSTTTYQWYMQTGSVACPSGAFNGTGWTAVGAASTSTPTLTGATIGNLTATTTFALRVYDTGTPNCFNNWAGNCHVVTVRPAFAGGTLASTAQTICNNTQPSDITYSTAPSGGSTTTYQWYRQTGSVSCPSGAFNGTGWTAVGASSTSTPSLTGATIGNLTATTTFALRVYDSGTPACYDNWAGNCHVVTVRPVFAGGTLTSAAQSICFNTTPANITYSVSPSGGSTTTYQWYMQTGSVACPSGAFNGTGWTAVGASSTSTPTLTGATIGNLTVTTTFALRVYDTGTPNCFNNWAGNCHVVTVRPVFAGGTLTSTAQTICNNSQPSDITYSTAPSGGSTTTYQWYMQTGSVACPSGAFNGTGWTAVAAASTSTPTLTGATIGNLTATTTFALRVYDSGTPACYDNWAGNCHVVTVRPVFAGGTLTSTAQTICNNTQPADITYSTAPSGGSTTTYQWYMQTGSVACPSGAFNGTGWTAVGASSTSTPTLTGATIGNLTATTTFALRVYDTGTPNCFNNWAGNCNVVTVRPTPTASISGTTTVCQNGTSPDVTFTNPQSLPITVTYNINGGTGQTINIGASSTATVAAPTGTDGTFNYNLVSVVYQTAPTCNSSITGTATITVDPAPNAAISGLNAICTGESTTYTASGGVSYLWSTGETTASIVVSTASSFTVTVTGANNCTASASKSLTVNPLPSVAISGTSTICNGQSTTLTASGGSSYLWNTAATTAAITITPGANTTYSVTATNGFSCTASTAQLVTVNARPTSVLSGNASVCNGIPSNITVTLTGTAPWSITFSDGFTVTGVLSSPYVRTVNPVATTTYTVTSLSDQNCTALVIDRTGSAKITRKVCSNTWIGYTTDWFTGTNWSIGSEPSCGSDAIVPTVPFGGQFPVVTANAEVGNLTVQNRAKIDINANIFLKVCGNFIGGSSVYDTIKGAGTLVMESANNQTISGRTIFNNLRSRKTAGTLTVVSNALIDINNALELQGAGNFDASVNRITFKSFSDTHSAVLDNFSLGFTGTFTGSIKAERSYAAVPKSWWSRHQMSSPVDACPVSQFAPSGTQGYAINSACDETKSDIGAPYGNFMRYDEFSATAPICGLQAWYNQTTGNAENARGYSVRRNGAGKITLNGIPNLNPDYTRTSLTNSNWSNLSKQGNTMTSGWHIMGNPYLAYLQINSPMAGFDNFVYVWSTNGSTSGSYEVYNVPGAGAVIPPFGTFTVHRSVPDNVGLPYSVSGSGRTRTATAPFYRLSQGVHLNIIATNTETALTDKAAIHFRDEAMSTFDAEEDALKLHGADYRHSLYTRTQREDLAVNALPKVIETTTVPLNMSPGVDGSYSFSFEGVNTFEDNLNIYLEDKFSGKWHNLRSGGAYNFTSKADDRADRFLLHFSYKTLTAIESIQSANIAFRMYPNPAHHEVIIETDTDEEMTIEVFDLNGKVVMTKVMKEYTSIDVSSLSAAVYQVKVTGSKGSIVKKLVKE
jgi:hypothetical protein